MNRRFSFEDKAAEPGSSYEGLRIFAAPGLHELAGQLVSEQLAPGGRVLDLGCGTGALSARLTDLGFAVAAADLSTVNFGPVEGVRAVEADLDREFLVGSEDEFDGVVALEIIEHLENPWHFLRRVHALLRPGGRLILSTPNVASSASQARFVRTGEFQWFTDSDYRQLGHLCPLPPTILRRCLSAAGLRLEALHSHGDASEVLRGWWKMRLLAKALDRLRGSSEDPTGDIVIALASKPEDAA